jgi:hypothetical protein
MLTVVLFLLSLLVSTQAKVATVTVQLNRENPWKYLTKFAISIGKGRWKARAKFVKPVDESSPDDQQATVSVYLDENWEESMYQDSCDKKKDSAKRDRGIRIPLNGEWGPDVEGTLSQKVRPHVWYFTASDCEGNLADIKPRIKFEFTFI